MWAIVQEAFGGPEELSYVRTSDPEPGPGELRIAVAAAGVHLLDTMIRRGDGPPRAVPPLPYVPGREVAGVVDQVGDGVSRDLTGRPVVVNQGLVSGGYAELAVARADAVHALAPDADLRAALAMIGTGRTVMAILELAQLASGDRVVVTGAAGGVGTLLVQAASSIGASVVGLVGNAEKAGALQDLGVDAVDHSRDDWLARLRNRLPGPASVILDGVGGELATALLDVTDVGGRLVLFGNASGKHARLTVEDVFGRGISIASAVGARLLNRPGGLRPLEERALQALESGALRPLVRCAFPLPDAAVAHALVEAHTTIGKVVLAP